MSEFGRSGGQLPNNEASQREHFREVGEDIRRERELDKIEAPKRERPWWRFWRRRS